MKVVIACMKRSFKKRSITVPISHLYHTIIYSIQPSWQHKAGLSSLGEQWNVTPLLVSVLITFMHWLFLLSIITRSSVGRKIQTYDIDIKKTNNVKHKVEVPSSAFFRTTSCPFSLVFPPRSAADSVFSTFGDDPQKIMVPLLFSENGSVWRMLVCDASPLLLQSFAPFSKQQFSCSSSFLRFVHLGTRMPLTHFDVLLLNFWNIVVHCGSCCCDGFSCI